MKGSEYALGGGGRGLVIALSMRAGISGKCIICCG